MLKMKKDRKRKEKKRNHSLFSKIHGVLILEISLSLSSYPGGSLLYKPYRCVSKGKSNFCNEIEELKNKLQKVTDDLSKINMADMPNGNCHQEKRIQLNLCQANMATSSASK